MNTRAIHGLALLLLLLLACGGSGDAPAEPAGVTTEGGEADGAPNIPFAEMTPEQKGAFMRDRVVPEMEALFQGFNATEFAEFGCPTCHGENGRDVSFRMPNGIHPLNPAEIGAMAESAEDGPVTRFMMEQVKPRMAALLGRAQYTPDNPDGFGCFQCHGMVE
jgi:hypothetical protein